MANANLDLPSFVFQRPIPMDPDINFRAAYKLTLKYLRALCAVRPSHPPPRSSLQYPRGLNNYRLAPHLPKRIHVFLLTLEFDASFSGNWISNNNKAFC